MSEKIFFKNNNGNNLCGILSNPTLKEENPIIILCHGFATSKDSSSNLMMEKILNEKGFSTFRFDFFGHGESEGDLADITLSQAVDDIISAIEFLKSSDYKKIGLVGSSFGGMAGILAVSESKDIYILALKSPVSDLYELLIQNGENFIKDWKEKGFINYQSGDSENFKLKYSFFEDVKKFNAYKVAQKIKIPTLIVHGDNDESVPIQQSKKLVSLIKNCELRIIEGADHRYSRPEDFIKMLFFISKFIIENSN